jgi:hypothetical protein
MMAMTRRATTMMSTDDNINNDDCDGALDGNYDNNDNDGAMEGC